MCVQLHKLCLVQFVTTVLGHVVTTVLGQVVTTVLGQVVTTVLGHVVTTVLGHIVTTLGQLAPIAQPASCVLVMTMIGIRHVSYMALSLGLWHSPI